MIPQLGELAHSTLLIAAWTTRVVGWSGLRDSGFVSLSFNQAAGSGRRLVGEGTDRRRQPLGPWPLVLAKSGSEHDPPSEENRVTSLSPGVIASLQERTQ